MYVQTAVIMTVKTYLLKKRNNFFSEKVILNLRLTMEPKVYFFKNYISKKEIHQILIVLFYSRLL